MPMFSNRAQYQLGIGELDWANSTKAAFVTLLTASFSTAWFADLDRIDVAASTQDIKANELSGTSFRQEISTASRTVNLDDTNDLVYYDGADVTISSGGTTGVVGYICLMQYGTTDTSTDSYPIALWKATEFNAGGITYNGGTITLTWSTAGIFKTSSPNF